MEREVSGLMWCRLVTAVAALRGRVKQRHTISCILIGNCTTLTAGENWLGNFRLCIRYPLVFISCIFRPTYFCYIWYCGSAIKICEENNMVAAYPVPMLSLFVYFPGVTTHCGCIFHSPVVGFSLLVFEISWSHTLRRATVRRTPLDEWSIRRRALYLTTHNTHKQTSMPPVRFEPTIAAGERPKTYVLDRAATGTGVYVKTLRRRNFLLNFSTLFI